MHVRALVATCLLSCSGYAQDRPAEKRPLPTPFAAPPRLFNFAKPRVPVAPAPQVDITPQAQIAPPASATCSVPLVNVTPPIAQSNMPVINPSANSNAQYTMGFVSPPAPPCTDRTGRPPQTPEPKP